MPTGISRCEGHGQGEAMVSEYNIQVKEGEILGRTGCKITRLCERGIVKREENIFSVELS